MAGREVSRQELDAKLADTVLSIREAAKKVNIITGFLAQHPVDTEGIDPLTVTTSLVDPMDPTSAPGKYGYTEAEAALIRQVFTALNDVTKSTTLAATLVMGSQLTGLE